MSRVRRKQFNAINAPALARGILLTVFLAVTGVIYVSRSVQIYHLGDRKRALEVEVAALQAQNKGAKNKIDSLTSSKTLERRRKEGYLKMVPIAERNIVRINAAQTAARTDTLQLYAAQRSDE